MSRLCALIGLWVWVARSVLFFRIAAGAAGVHFEDQLAAAGESATPATDNEGRVVPGVAESWKQKDPTTWVFTLRKNAKWSDGSSVTADDFVYGIRRFLDPKTASTYATTYGTSCSTALKPPKARSR